MNFNAGDLIGHELAKIQLTDDEIVFTRTDGRVFRMYHSQDCCESVYIKEIVGDVADLVGTPILEAYEESNSPEDVGSDSVTWTFYKIATVRGTVNISWYGESNGYYSESVDWMEVK